MQSFSIIVLFILVVGVLCWLEKSRFSYRNRKKTNEIDDLIQGVEDNHTAIAIFNMDGLTLEEIIEAYYSKGETNVDSWKKTHKELLRLGYTEQEIRSVCLQYR